MNKFLKPILAFILFIVLQVVASFVVMGIVAATNADFVNAVKSADSVAMNQATNNLINPTVLSLALILSSVLTIIAMIWPLRMFNITRDCKSAKLSFGIGAIAVIGAIVGIIGTNILSEFLDLPNFLEAQLEGMFSSVLGVLVIGVVGPIAEEVVFRASILGYMLRKGVDKWVAIIVSSFIFGIMHFNPAQIPFAMIVGIILGVIYYRTGNILLTSLIHILNNSVACLLNNIYGEDYKITEGCETISAIIGVAMLALSAFMLYKFWLSTKQVSFAENYDE